MKKTVSTSVQSHMYLQGNTVLVIRELKLHENIHIILVVYIVTVYVEKMFCIFFFTNPLKRKADKTSTRHVICV